MTEIAIVGIGCRFPGGVTDAASYWSLLIEGRCAIREIPSDRWSLDGFYDETPDLPNRAITRWGGFLDDIHGFDPSYFGLSAREAEAMDPQQRLLLQVACEAVQDARLPLGALRRTPTGVFIGVSNIDYAFLQRYRPGVGDIQAGTGTALSIVANRVSNRLDLTGPSMGVDTACSSALVAVDTACRHLADGSCDAGLAGGVNILLDPRMFITFSRAHMLSPSGRIRAFDAAADGFVRGEGVGVVLLKRLEDALASGDRIYAVIEATAVNQDGRTGTITEPSQSAQVAMMKTVARLANIAVGDLSYVEAHGTGTPVGDPIEANAIGEVFGCRHSGQPLWIGSAKTNLGHLEPAAGIAGLIKAALVVHHRTIPPSIGFERPNPAIPFDDLGLAVATGSQPLRKGDAVGRVLVNSFGFGGTNACALLSDASPNPLEPASGRRCATEWAAGHGPIPAISWGEAPIPVPLSGPTQAHVQHAAAALAKAIECGPLAHRSVREISAALAAQRDHHDHRAVLIASTPAALAERLRCLADGREWPKPDRHAPPQILTGRAAPARNIAFTMTGQGGQWWAMGRDLIEREPLFRRVIEDFDREFTPVAGWSVMTELLASQSESRIDDAAITPAVMFAFQTALAELWRSIGVTPDIVLGHSFGEVTAAYLAGGIKTSSIARLVNHRGLIRSAVDRIGTMAAIGLGADAIARWLPVDGSIEIGGYNAPDMVTVTGDAAAIEDLIARLTADDPTILTRKLALDFAYHSSWFEPVEAIFKADVGMLDTAPPKLPVVSTVTGDLNATFDADYWWCNLRQPVLYQKAIERALELGADTFIELGPHRTLSSMTKACAAGVGHEVLTVTSLDRHWGDHTSLAVALAELWVAGIPIDWPALTGRSGRDVELPRQPWFEQPLWRQPEEATRILRAPAAHPLLGRADVGAGNRWTVEISLATHPWLGDHRVDGACIFPAAGYLEMLYTAAAEVLGVHAVELVDVTFDKAQFIGPDDELMLQTIYSPERRRISIHARLRDRQAGWQQCAAATVYPLQSEACAGTLTAVASGAAEPLDIAAFYAAAEQVGYGWSGRFRGLRRIERGSGWARGDIDVVPHGPPRRFNLDPRLVDSALQLMFACFVDEQTPRALPNAIDRVAVHSPLDLEAQAAASARVVDDGGNLLATVQVSGANGAPQIVIEGLHAARRPTADNQGGAGAAHFYREEFVPLDIASASRPTLPGCWLMLVRAGCGAAERLARAIGTHASGIDVVRLDEREAADRNAYARAITSALSSGPVAGIVYAVALASPSTVELDCAPAVEDSTIQLTALGQALAALANTEAPLPVAVLTMQARAYATEAGGPHVNLGHAGLPALARTIALEVPAVHVRMIDLDHDALNDPARLAELITSGSAESEIMLREGRTLASRIRQVGIGDLPPAFVDWASPRSTPNFALRLEGGQGPERLAWREVAVPDLQDDEVLVEVGVVGLNFRDAMAVAGLLPTGAEPTPAADSLGLEFAGTVRGLGKAIRGLDIGERVLGMRRGALQRRIACPQIALARVPAGLSQIAAATIPSAYLTAHYALNEVGRLKAGETVLIHSAAGGVGLAALAIARRAGAQLIATAGTAEKRAYLSDLGIEHIFDSRSLGFADEALEATGGRGVDIVLNSLGGPFIDKGLACLAPYGRCLELGKRDIHADAGVGLRSMRRNASLHVIDVAALIEDRPAEAARLLGEILGMIARGEIEPLPATAFPACEAAEAVRRFSSADHVGKIVLDLGSSPPPIRRAFGSGAPLDRRASYLVTGGTRGFGLEVARWLAARGAGRVIVASRSGRLPDDAAADQPIEPLSLDVTDVTAVERMIARLARSDLPLRGIIHAAVDYDDAMLADMTPARTRRVLAAKVDGALNLTRAVMTAGAKLDFMVSFSSLAQTVGWPGQSSYAAANGFLEGLAHWQQANGLPGRAIIWGALGETGQVARNQGIGAYLESAGWIGLDTSAALQKLAEALDTSAPAIAIAAADWRRLAAAHPALARAPRLADLTRPTGSQLAIGERSLHALTGNELKAAAVRLVCSEVARVLRVSAESLDPSVMLQEAGIDSLSSFELRNRIGQAAGIELPLAHFTRARRIADLADLLCALIDDHQRAAKGSTPPAAPQSTQ